MIKLSPGTSATHCTRTARSQSAVRVCCQDWRCAITINCTHALGGKDRRTQEGFFHFLTHHFFCISATPSLASALVLASALALAFRPLHGICMGVRTHVEVQRHFMIVPASKFCRQHLDATKKIEHERCFALYTVSFLECPYSGKHPYPAFHVISFALI
jgi:hypothetical protein